MVCIIITDKCNEVERDVLFKKSKQWIDRLNNESKGNMVICLPRGYAPNDILEVGEE